MLSSAHACCHGMYYKCNCDKFLQGPHTLSGYDTCNAVKSVGRGLAVKYFLKAIPLHYITNCQGLSNSLCLRCRGKY